MKRIFLGVFALSMLGLTSCKKDTVTPAEDNTTVINDTLVKTEEVTPKEASGGKVVGITCNNEYEINVHWAENPEDSITVDVVKDGKSEIFKMAHVESGSGAKYQSADGHYIWNKGKDYMFGKGEQTLASCSEK